MRKKFTDRFIKSLRAAPKGKRVEHWDTIVHGLGVRVTDRGVKSYVMYRRWPGSTVPTRRKIHEEHATDLPLAKARTIARQWLELLAQGIDPKTKERAEEIEEQRRNQSTFAAVAEDWFRDEVSRQRKADEVERHVRMEFVARWGDRPITSITTLEIRNVIKDKALGLIPAPGARKLGPAPEQARNLLGYVKQLFNYAVDQHSYGLEKSPADPLRGDKLCGKKVRRKRVLSDDELREVWLAAEETEYPYGPLIQMLILTGQRRSEVAGARWSEFDMTRKLWTIPAERMKAGTVQVVPLTEDLIALLAGPPRFNSGDHLFSTGFGERACNGFSKAKERLDELIGDKIEKHWTFHDLRRTMRTGLSALAIPDRVRELMIAHAQPGLHQVYDQYSYVEEKRHGFALWHSHLRGILQPPPVGSNVIELHR
jgi:integrase